MKCSLNFLLNSNNWMLITDRNSSNKHRKANIISPKQKNSSSLISKSTKIFFQHNTLKQFSLIDTKDSLVFRITINYYISTFKYWRTTSTFRVLDIIHILCCFHYHFIYLTATHKFTFITPFLLMLCLVVVLWFLEVVDCLQDLSLVVILVLLFH